MSTSAQKYFVLRVEGPINIVPITAKEVKHERLDVYILMGPTGSGKSSFIESMAPDQHLNLSKDSLESVTHEANCYQVVNLGVQPGWADRLFVLMDSPGFLDPTMSEGRITRMITERLDAFQASSESTYVFLLYFQPITDIRIGGSKRHAFKMLREYVKLYNAQSITVITTMWNTLFTPNQFEDANRRFNILKNELYASTDGLDIVVTKFDTSSKGSALYSLDDADGSWFCDEGDSDNITMNPLYQSLLCDNLLRRITTLLQQLQMMAEDKRSATSPGSEDHRLLEVVLRDETVALASLQAFLDDLASDDIGVSGMVVLQSLLDARYEEDPGACLSPWLPQVSRAALAWHQLHSPHVPTPSTTHCRTPSPVTSFFVPIVASLKKRLSRTRR